MVQAEDEFVSDFEFDGNWREYAVIALTNLVLTIATLGIYRFWATTRVRRYLWSRTLFMGNRLEWAGTGSELFRSGLMALLVVLVPLAVANLTIRYLIVHKYMVAGQVLSLIVLALFYTLVGTAVLRGLRYRLSRTYWRGIRGGSHDQGLRYGFAHVWKKAVGLLPLGALMPWAMTSLWNQRWNAMSFGPWPFVASGRVSGLRLPYLWCYVAPAVVIAATVLLAGSNMTLTWFGIDPRTPFEWVLIRLPALFALLFMFAMITLAYHATFFRQMVRSTSLGDINFSFNAGAPEWMGLYLVDMLLVVSTLGLGWIFISYRHWTFYLRNLQTYGSINIDAISQSVTPAPRQGEGLLDAFNMEAL
ncbi:MAG: YjgN family protein [Novosphingobium sp.]